MRTAVIEVMAASLASSMVAEANVCRSLEARGPGRVEAFWATIVNGARTAANVLSAQRAVRDHDAGVSLPRAVLGRRADECELGVEGVVYGCCGVELSTFARAA